MAGGVLDLEKLRGRLKTGVACSAMRTSAFEQCPRQKNHQESFLIFAIGGDLRLSALSFS
jgi:hypothetical protein